MLTYSGLVRKLMHSEYEEDFLPQTPLAPVVRRVLVQPTTIMMMIGIALVTWGLMTVVNTANENRVKLAQVEIQMETNIEVLKKIETETNRLEAVAAGQKRLNDYVDDWKKRIEEARKKAAAKAANPPAKP